MNNLSSHGLPEAKLELVRQYLGLGERSKHTEQKLNYLLRCKVKVVFPVYILNGIKANCVRDTNYTQYLLKKLRKVSLNQSIEQNHNVIKECKDKLSEVKHQLYLSTPYQFYYMKYFTHRRNIMNTSKITINAT